MPIDSTIQGFCHQITVDMYETFQLMITCGDKRVAMGRKIKSIHPFHFLVGGGHKLAVIFQ